MNKLSKKQLLHNLNLISRFLYESAQHYATAPVSRNQQRITQFDQYIFGHSNRMVQIIMQLMKRYKTGNS